MLNTLLGILFLILAYLIGSIPWGFIFGKMHGIDIRTVGSKNIGATNTGRILGKKYAILVYILDMIKGALIVLLFRFNILPKEWCLLNPMIYGLASVLGHTFPIYLGFKGGKSVSCGSGAVAGYCPYFLPFAFILFFTLKKCSKLVSFSSLISTIFTFVFALTISLVTKQFTTNLFTYPESGFWPFNAWFVLCTFLIGLIIFVRHTANIKRIIKHEEKPADY